MRDLYILWKLCIIYPLSDLVTWSFVTSQIYRYGSDQKEEHLAFVFNGIAISYVYIFH